MTELNLKQRYVLGSTKTTDFCFLKLTFKQLDNGGTNYVAPRKMDDIMCEIETKYDRVSPHEHLPALCLGSIKITGFCFLIYFKITG